MEMIGTTEKNQDFKLFNFRPVFFGAVLLCLGVFFAYLHIVEGIALWWFLLLLPVAAIPFFFCKDRKAALSLLTAELCLFLCFWIGFHALRAQIDDFKSCGKYAGEQVVYGVVEEKEELGDSVLLVLTEVKINGQAEKGRLCAYLPASKCKQVERCATVLLRGEMKTDTSLLAEYGFRANDIEKGEHYVLWSENDVAVTGTGGGLFLRINAELDKTIKAGINQNAAAVAMGILFGDVGGMDASILRNIRVGGIAHVFAVSGLHVGVLYGFFAWLLKNTGLKSLPVWLRFLLLAFVLFFYAGICGFTSSVLRATVLCLCLYFSSVTEIKIDGLETIGFAAFLLLLFNPVALFTVGFQLSFLACLGIILLAKPIGQVCVELVKYIGDLLKKGEEETQEEREERPLNLGELLLRDSIRLLSASIAAQITTAPVLLSVFGYLSGWSLLLNFIFVPLVSAVFALLLIFVLIAALLPLSAASVVLFIPNAVWSAVLLLFEIFDFTGFALTGIAVSGAGCICYYLGWTFLTDKWNLSKTHKAWLTALCAVGTLVCTLAANL